MNCHCGEADGIQDMVGCEWGQGITKCNVWKHICSGVGENTSWYCVKLYDNFGMFLYIHTYVYIYSVYCFNIIIVMKYCLRN